MMDKKESLAALIRKAPGSPVIGYVGRDVFGAARWRSEFGHLTGEVLAEAVESAVAACGADAETPEVAVVLEWTAPVSRRMIETGLASLQTTVELDLRDFVDADGNVEAGALEDALMDMAREATQQENVVHAEWTDMELDMYEPEDLDPSGIDLESDGGAEERLNEYAEQLDP